MKQYLDFDGLSRYHELLRGLLASLSHTITVQSGLKADGTTNISATSASAANPSVILGDSGITAGSYGDSGNQTPNYGATFKVPYITVNAKGIVTGISEHTVKIPTTDNSDTKYYIILNGSTTGTTGGTNLGTIFAPTVVGSDGQILKSNGTGAPSWFTPNYLTTVPIDYKKSYASVVSVSANTNNVTCPSTLSSDGEECTVLYVNSGTTADYTVTISTDYTTPDGEQLSLTCPKGGYCEVNYLKIGNTIYARGV